MPEASKRPRASWWRGRRSTGSPPSVLRRLMPNDSRAPPTPGGTRYGAGIIELDVGEVGRMLTHDGALGRVRHHVLGRPRTPTRRRRHLHEARLRWGDSRQARHQTARRLDRQQLKPTSVVDPPASLSAEHRTPTSPTVSEYHGTNGGSPRPNRRLDGSTERRRVAGGGRGAATPTRSRSARATSISSTRTTPNVE